MHIYVLYKCTDIIYIYISLIHILAWMSTSPDARTHPLHFQPRHRLRLRLGRTCLRLRVCLCLWSFLRLGGLQARSQSRVETGLLKVSILKFPILQASQREVKGRLQSNPSLPLVFWRGHFQEWHEQNTEIWVSGRAGLRPSSTIFN